MFPSIKISSATWHKVASMVLTGVALAVERPESPMAVQAAIRGAVNAAAILIDELAAHPKQQEP